MKRSLLPLLALSLALPLAALAGKEDGPKAKLMAKYDLNHNGQLDPDEIAAIRKDFAANPDSELKRFDTDHDGKLSDAEIAAMVPGSGKKGGSHKKKGSDAAPAESSSPASSGSASSTSTPAPAPDTKPEAPAPKN